jgi:uncharacterized repeat protein (TIGR04076 family)
MKRAPTHRGHEVSSHDKRAGRSSRVARQTFDSQEDGGAVAESAGKRVRVEVVEIMGSGKCSSDLHKVGQAWVVSDAVVPPGMCAWAYNSIQPFITALRCDGRFPWRDDPVARVCCPDADNPVVFRVSIEH